MVCHLIVSVPPARHCRYHVLRDQTQALNLSRLPGVLPEGLGLQPTIHPVPALSDSPQVSLQDFSLAAWLFQLLSNFLVKFSILATLNISSDFYLNSPNGQGTELGTTPCTSITSNSLELRLTLFET